MEIINNNNVMREESSSDLSIKRGKVEKISFIVLLISIFLTPIVFVPSAYSSLDMVKTIVVSLGVIISGILYFISAWRNKELYFPKHPLILSGICIVISIIISTFLSTNFAKSFLGQAFEVGTASFFLLLFIGSLITFYLVNRDREKVIYIYTALIVSFILLTIFHVIRLIGGVDVMNSGIFTDLSLTPLGKWSDFGIMAGLLVILSYITLSFLNVNKVVKTLLGVLFLLSLVVLVFVNNSIIWFVLALSFLGISIYKYYLKSRELEGESKIGKIFNSLPWISVIILIISFIFAWNGQIVNDKLNAKLNLFPTDVSLTWQSTLDIASESIKESPLFGVGPNRFAQQYLRYKPLEVNLTQFYDLIFDHGFALIPTFFVTQGIVGGLLWLVFIVLFIVTGAREIKKNRDDFSRFIVVSTFFGTIFLWLMTLVNFSAHSILFLTFIFLGLFIASIDIQKYNFSQKIVLPTVLIICVVLVGWMFLYSKKTLALVAFQSGIEELKKESGAGIDSAEKDFERALLLDEDDIYYQALSEIDLIKVTTLIQKSQQAGNGNVDQTTIDEVLKLIDEAIKYTDSAIAIDPTNYYNYIAQSRVLETGMMIGVKDHYEKIKDAYAKALSINKFSPSLYLSLARIEYANKDIPNAESHIGTSLQLKQNYIDAIFFLSQVQVSQGRIADAITSTKVTTQLNPNNPLLFFQLGLLYYNNKEFDKAIEAFESAIKLDKNYANAQYFLGLSYARIGKNSLAVPYFEALSETNPDNEEVKFILTNLRSGKSPFAEVKPPIDSNPEKRKSLPVKETKTTTSTKTSTKSTNP
jgi:tetratricopeptide (TPR) repeat protein